MDAPPPLRFRRSNRPNSYTVKDRAKQQGWETEAQEGVEPDAHLSDASYEDGSENIK